MSFGVDMFSPTTYTFLGWFQPRETEQQAERPDDPFTTAQKKEREMKTLLTAFATMVLVLGLPSAAIANEPVEIAIGGEDEDGDKIDVVFQGTLGQSPPIKGFMKIDCADTAPTASTEDEEAELVISAADVSGTADCLTITLTGTSLGTGSPKVDIEICDTGAGNRTKVNANGFDATGCATGGGPDVKQFSAAPPATGSLKEELDMTLKLE